MPGWKLLADLCFLISRGSVLVWHIIMAFQVEDLTTSERGNIGFHCSPFSISKFKHKYSLCATISSFGIILQSHNYWSPVKSQKEKLNAFKAVTLYQSNLISNRILLQQRHNKIVRVGLQSSREREGNGRSWQKCIGYSNIGRGKIHSFVQDKRQVLKSKAFWIV